MLTGLEVRYIRLDIVSMTYILVFGSTREQHDHRLHRVLGRLQEEGLTLCNDKCQFAVDKVMFLGHILSARGIEADPGKIKAITEMPTPKDAADVKRFVGMVNYVGKFSPRIAELTQPLRDLLKTDTDWVWGSAQQRAFDELRKELSSPNCWHSKACTERQQLQQTLPPLGWEEFCLRSSCLENGGQPPLYYLGV